MDARILLVEDELEILEETSKLLRSEGYEVVVATTGAEALIRYPIVNPDLVILDVLLPKLSGFDVCREIRKIQVEHIPILMISGWKQTASDYVTGLELGADKYLRKPVRPEELLADVRASLRASQANKSLNQTDGLWIVDDYLQIYQNRHEIRVDGRIVPLTGLEFKLLIHFVAHAGDVCTHEELIGEVWHVKDGVQPSTISSLIARLRRKIEPDRDRFQYILSVHGVGYRFTSG